MASFPLTNLFFLTAHLLNSFRENFQMGATVPLQTSQVHATDCTLPVTVEGYERSHTFTDKPFSVVFRHNHTCITLRLITRGLLGVCLLVCRHPAVNTQSSYDPLVLQQLQQVTCLQLILGNEYITTDECIHPL